MTSRSRCAEEEEGGNDEMEGGRETITGEPKNRVLLQTCAVHVRLSSTGTESLTALEMHLNLVS